MKRLIPLILLLASCDKYLDTMPDNRATVDTEQNITSLLVSAYPTTHHAVVAELYSDNTDEVTTNSYNTYSRLQEQCATWQDITEENSDSPYGIWEDSYMAIATANTVLEAIDEAGNPSSLAGQRAEALMCRAYNHWVLCSVFCQAYSMLTSDKDLGIPYIKDVETTVTDMSHADRGTVAQVYANIDRDIQEALPLLNDGHLKSNKYHFNKKAAYAFATRFYLMYTKPDKSNYEQAVKYAGEVLGSDPSALLRDWKELGTHSVNDFVRANAYIDAAQPANLLIYSTQSVWARIHGAYMQGARYCHNYTLASTESCAPTPWGDRSSFYSDIPQYTGLPKAIMSKMGEYFEYVDATSGIGYPHVMYTALTTDETILNRAEAYVMLGKYDLAAADLNAWGTRFYDGAAPVSAIRIAAFYNELDYYTPTHPTPRKQMNPDYTIEPGTQEGMMQAVVSARRILQLHEGNRLFDVKRLGITIYRRTINGNDYFVHDSLPPHSPRLAVQIPQSVVKAGIVPNPR